MTDTTRVKRRTRQNLSIRGGDDFKRLVARMAVETNTALTELLRVLIDLGIEAYAKREGYSGVEEFMERHLIPWPLIDNAPKAKNRKDAARERLAKRMAEAEPGQRLFPAKVVVDGPEPPLLEGEIDYAVPADAEAPWDETE